MPTIDELLRTLRSMAKADPQIAKRLLATADMENPVDAFCKMSTELGVPIGVMDLVSAGEEYYAAMRRSTNGGGENSPLLAGEDDYYELFMAELRDMI